MPREDEAVVESTLKIFQTHVQEKGWKKKESAVIGWRLYKSEDAAERGLVLLCAASALRHGTVGGHDTEKILHLS